MNRSASSALVIQSLRPLMHPVAGRRLSSRARRQRERVAARSGLGQGVGADRARREARQVAALQIVAAPAKQRVDDERVLDVDEHANRRVDARQRLDGEHGVKEAGAAAAQVFRDLDPHDAEPEQLVDERAGNRGVLVHLADERADLAVGELVDAVAEQPLFVGERGQRERRPGSSRFGRLRHAEEGSMAGASKNWWQAACCDNLVVSSEFRMSN